MQSMYCFGSRRACLEGKRDSQEPEEGGREGGTDAGRTATARRVHRTSIGFGSGLRKAGKEENKPSQLWEGGVGEGKPNREKKGGGEKRVREEDTLPERGGEEVDHVS